MLANIIQRVVMKRADCRMQETADGIEDEVRILTRLPWCESIIRTRGSAKESDVRPPHFTVRIYTEYAPAGDLKGILGTYATKDGQIPEPFIWTVFLGLAEAIFTLNMYRCATEAEERGEALETVTNPKKGKHALAIHHRGMYQRSPSFKL
jgi:hypothetical protein